MCWETSPEPSARPATSSNASSRSADRPAQRSATQPFTRPSIELSRRPVTKEQLAQFRSNPLSLQGKLFLHAPSGWSGDHVGAGGGIGGGGSSNSSGTRAQGDGEHDELFYKIIGFLFPAEGARLVLQFAGCRAPDERPAEVIYDLIALSMLVEV